MPCRMKMFGRVPVRRRIAAGYMTARFAETQVQPRATNTQTVFANTRARLHFVLYLGQMCAGRSHNFQLDDKAAVSGQVDEHQLRSLFRFQLQHRLVCDSGLIAACERVAVDRHLSANDKEIRAPLCSKLMRDFIYRAQG